MHSKSITLAAPASHRRHHKESHGPLGSSRRPLSATAAAFAVATIFASVLPASAATLSWDPGSHADSVASGGDGTWDFSDTDNWFDSAVPGNTDWTNDNDALFAGAAGTVTVGAAVAPLSLKFDSAYTLNGAAITTATLSVKANTAVTLNNVISGTNLTIGLPSTSTYNGTLTLGAASNYSGTTLINSGIVKLGVNNALPVTTTLSGSGNPASTFDLNGFNQSVVNIAGASQSTITNTSATRSTLTLTTAGTITAGSQILTGNLNVTKTGAGTWLPNSDSTFTGVLTISAGSMTVTTNARLGAVGQATVRLDGTGNLILNGTAFSASAVFDRDIELAGTATLLRTSGAKVNTISGVISGDLTGELRFGSGQGALTLGGANTYKGPTRLQSASGMVIAAHDNAFGESTIITQGAAGTVGFQKSLTNQNINVGSLTDITFSQSVGGHGFGSIHNLNGDNSFAGDITMAGNTQLYVAEAGSSLLLKGNIGESVAGRAFNASHAGTIALSGANTYTGATTVSDGTLRLDFSEATAPADYIINNGANSSALVLNGATLEIRGKSGAVANNQRFNGFTVNAGASAINVNASGNTVGVNVSLGGITRTAVGGTVNFVLPASGTISTTASNTDGILGGYATVSGTGWATVADGNIAALAVGDYTSDTWGGMTNTNVTIGSAPGTDATTNSLRFHNTAANTVTLDGPNNVITSGGILVTSNVGNNLSQITAGTLKGLVGKDLIIHQNNVSTLNTVPDNNSTRALVIGSQISDNGTTTGLTKSGAGTLSLTASNNYTGKTTVAQGVLKLDHANALPGGIGNAGGTSNLELRGGTLGLTADFLRGLGTGASQVQFTSHGGFAAYGADRTVNIGNGVTDPATAVQMQWWSSPTTAGFLKPGQALLLGADDATNTVIFVNRISLMDGNNTVSPIAREIRVANGSAAVDARITGIISTGYSSSTNSGGEAGILKTGAGTLELSAANTYSAQTIVDGGTLLVTGTINTASGIFVNNGATLRQGAHGVSGGHFLTVNSGTVDLAGFNETARNLILGGGSASTTSTVTTGAGTLTLGGDVTYNGNFSNANGATISGNLSVGTAVKTFTINDSNAAADDLTISALISGTGSLTKAGTGTLKLSTANSYSGLTTVAGGTLAYGISDVLSSGAVTVSGGTLALASFSDTVGTVTLSSGSITSSTGVLTGTSYSLTNTGAVSAILAGAVALTKTGAGTATLSGANTYSGTTAINTGTLQFAKKASLYTGIESNWTPAKISVASGATLALNVGGTDEFTTGDVSTLLTNLSTVINNGLKTGSRVGFDTTNAGTTVTYSPVIANSTGAGGGAVGVAKLGTGTLALTGVNSYTGPTTVTGGTLEVSGGINGSNSVNVTNGALLLSASHMVKDDATVTLANGILKTGGNSEFVGTDSAIATAAGLGALALSSTSTIDFGAGTSTLWFSNLAGITTGILNIDNWSGNVAGGGTDQLRFTSDPSAFLGQISFNGNSGATEIFFNNGGNSYYEIVPVPEPSSTALVGSIALLGLGGFRERRRIRSVA